LPDKGRGGNYLLKVHGFPQRVYIDESKQKEIMKRKLFIALKEGRQVVEYTDSIGIKGKTVEDLVETIVAKGDKATEMVIQKLKESPKETWKKLKQLFSKSIIV